ncbi:MAG: carboxypeptidase-like regulatory domain-containing protein [Bryobacteraceae bacterium]
MKTIPFLRSVCLVALLSATTLATAWSQIRSGTIVGKVTDARGYAVPGVEIAIRETGTNYTYNLKSNEVGEFTQPYLPFGAYEIVARKEGFKTLTQTGLTLSTAQTLRVDLFMEVGSVETAISVSVSVVELQTESSRVTNAVSEQVIRSIPNINNNPLNYATLQLGVGARHGCRGDRRFFFLWHLSERM